MLGILKTVLEFVFFFYVLVAILLFIFQRNLIYFPSADFSHNFKTEKFLIEGETINVIVLNENKKNAIMYFAGNAEAVISSAESFEKTFPEHTVYLINYRGYGGSTGEASEEALNFDSLYIYDELIKKHSFVSIIGRSLGSGIATYLASKRDIDKLVLITPYDSIQNIAQNRFPIYPMSILLKDKYDSLSRVKNIKANVLIVLAQYDVVITLKHSQNLIKAFPKEQIDLKMILNKGHNDLSLDEEYYPKLHDFISNKWKLFVKNRLSNFRVLLNKSERFLIWILMLALLIIKSKN